MTFKQLAIGQRFRFRGVIYRKATPLMACPEGEQTQVLVPRSAKVDVLDTGTIQQAITPPREIPVAQLEYAMNALAEEMNVLVAESGLDAMQANKLMRQMRNAFQKTRHSLNLP